MKLTIQKQKNDYDDLREELQEMTQKYLRAKSQRDSAVKKLEGLNGNIRNFEKMVSDKVQENVKKALKDKECDFEAQEQNLKDNQLMITKLSYHKKVMTDTISYLEKELKVSKVDVQKAVSENKELIEKLQQIEDDQRNV